MLIKKESDTRLGKGVLGRKRSVKIEEIQDISE